MPPPACPRDSISRVRCIISYAGLSRCALGATGFPRAFLENSSSEKCGVCAGKLENSLKISLYRPRPRSIHNATAIYLVGGRIMTIFGCFRLIAAAFLLLFAVASPVAGPGYRSGADGCGARSSGCREDRARYQRHAPCHVRADEQGDDAILPDRSSGRHRTGGVYRADECDHRGDEAGISWPDVRVAGRRRAPLCGGFQRRGDGRARRLPPLPGRHQAPGGGGGAADPAGPAHLRHRSR